MQVHQVQPASWVSYVIPIVVLLLVMTLRMRRMGRMRPLKLEQLWIVPALYLVVVAGLFAQHPPTLVGWLAAVAAFAIGGALGWQRGKFMEIHVDPETHALNQKASMAGMLFLVALIAVRFAVRAAGGGLHVNAAMLIDMLAAFALGMFAMQRLEMYLRAKRLLAEARGDAL